MPRLVPARPGLPQPETAAEPCGWAAPRRMPRVAAREREVRYAESVERQLVVEAQSRAPAWVVRPSAAEPPYRARPQVAEAQAPAPGPRPLAPVLGPLVRAFRHPTPSPQPPTPVLRPLGRAFRSPTPSPQPPTPVLGLPTLVFAAFALGIELPGGRGRRCERPSRRDAGARRPSG